MKKTRIATCALLLLLSLVVSLPAVAQGWHISVTWGSRYDQTAPDLSEMTYTCDYITNYCFLSQPSWGGQNAFATYGLTTGYNVYTTAMACRDNPNYDFVATFHVGHYVANQVPGVQYYWDPYYGWVWYYDGSQIRHYGYYADRMDGTDANNLRIEDRNLYWYTGDKHRFTLIWTCVNGDLKDLNGDGVGDAYGYYDSAHNTGAVGIPYAWTRTLAMSQNGYTNPDGYYRCYIGFENISRGLAYSSPEFNYNTYGLFVRYFYYNAALNHHTIINALNEATDALSTSKQYFWQTELYMGYYETNEYGTWWSKMRVFGDGNMVLPS